MMLTWDEDETPAARQARLDAIDDQRRERARRRRHREADGVHAAPYGVPLALTLLLAALLVMAVIASLGVT